MYNHSAKKINWLKPEDQTELHERKYIFHNRYMKMVNQVDEKEKDAKLTKGNQGKPMIGVMLDEGGIILDRNATDNAYPDMMNPRVTDDFMSEFANYMGENGGEPGVPGGSSDPNDNETCGSFFRRLIKIFDSINFYNLLFYRHAVTANQGGNQAPGGAKEAENATEEI